MIVAVFTLLSLDTYAYDKYTTSRITSLDGLSQNDVANIIQDSYGFMWIATNDGLCRYDGSEFKTFYIGDAGLETNLIQSLVEDKMGNIWVGTADKGLYYYVRKENHFYHFSQLGNPTLPIQFNAIRHLTLAPDGSLWGCEVIKQILFRFNLDQDKRNITTIDIFRLKGMDVKSTNAIVTIGPKTYIGTSEGALIYDADTDGLELLDSGEDNIAEVSDIKSKDGELFLATSEAIIAYDLDNNSFKRYEFDIEPRKIHWQGESLWMVARDGVFTARYNSREDKFEELELVESFTDNFSYNIIEDHTGGIWVGFHKAGLRRYELNKRPFMVTRGLGNNHIHAIYNSPNDELWIGTEGSGIFLLDSINGDIKENILTQSTINSIAYTPQNDSYYIATNNNLTRATNKHSDWEFSDTLLNDKSVRMLLVDGKYLWAALFGSGVVRMDLSDDTLTYITYKNNLPSNIARNLMKDRDGNIWICTSKGVVMIPHDRRFDETPMAVRVLPETTNEQYTISIAEDRDGDIWYGTLGHGLYRLQKDPTCESGYKAKNFTTKDGLTNNVIKAIIEDDNGLIWISTNRGLSTLNASNDGVIISNFDISDGLQDYEFNELSATKLADGTLLFGGVSGYNYFNPNNFTIDSTQIRPIITDFQIFDQSILDGEQIGEIAPDGLQGDEGVQLKYNQNNFTIKFAGLHYDNPSKHRYKYMLNGVDPTWVNPSDDLHSVSYTNLSPGDYTFKLRAANEDGVWADKTLKFKISIDSPFWAKWYAYIIYVLLAAVVIYLFTRYLRSEMERRNMVAYVDMEKRKMQEMLDMRTRFFTNISHEFRTPLTLILTPLQQLIADDKITSNAKWRDHLETMNHNGNSLMRLINEFLSYAKQESGSLEVQLSESEFTSVTQKLFEQFKFWAEQRGITLRYNAPTDDVVISFDQYLIEQVIYNLVSNAIKYTPSGGDITLRIEEKNDHIIFSVEDSGCGISEEMQPYIFERFYSRTSESSKEVGGTGVGLFLTKNLVKLHDGEIWFTTQIDKGTTFFVKLPKSVANEVDPPTHQIAGEMEYGAEENEQMQSQQIESESSAPPTLLIVDDNIETVKLLSGLFKDSYTIITAKDGVEGVELAMKELPDIIISDVMMPRMDGLELCDKIKSDTSTSHIPVILLSAKATDNDISAGLRCSADAYCPKPFNNEVLIETTNSILTNRRTLANKFSAIKGEEDGHVPLTLYTDETTTNTDKVFLKRLTEYIESNIHNPDLVVNDLCNYMGITPLVLNKKLKSLIDMTANALIRTIRLRRAAALLKTSRYTIADVTYDVGFSDLRYFRECFKREFGVLPQEYRDQSANGAIIEPKQSTPIGDAAIDAVAKKSIRTRSERAQRGE